MEIIVIIMSPGGDISSFELVQRNIAINSKIIFEQVD